MIRRVLLLSILLASAAQADEPGLRWGGGLDASHPIWANPTWAQPGLAEPALAAQAWSPPDLTPTLAATGWPPPDPTLLAAAPDTTPGAATPAAAPPSTPEPAPPPRGEPLLNDDYWLNYLTNIPRMFTAPLRFDTTDWIKTGAFVIAAGGAYLGDEHIRQFFRDHRTSTGDSIAAIGYRLGDGKTILGGVAVAYAAGYATEDHKLRDTALLSLQAWALTGGITEGTKYLAGRQRPGYTDDKSQFDGPGSAGKSFFSGHAANAFTVAAVVSEQYDEIWVAPVAYGLAGLVAWSRLNDNAHWASDVVVGAGVGYAVGKLVAHFSPFRDDLGVTATPMLAPGGGGVQLGFRF